MAVLVKNLGGGSTVKLLWSKTYSTAETVNAFSIPLDLSKYTHILIHLQTTGTADPVPAVWGLCKKGETSFVTNTVDTANRTYQESRNITVSNTSVEISACTNSTNQHAVPTAIYGLVIK